MVCRYIVSFHCYRLFFNISQHCSGKIKLSIVPIPFEYRYDFVATLPHSTRANQLLVVLVLVLAQRWPRESARSPLPLALLVALVADVEHPNPP